MSLNKRADRIGGVPIVIPKDSSYSLSIRGLVRSRLVASEIRFGPTQAVASLAKFPAWDDAYSIGIIFQDQRSDIIVNDRVDSIVRRKHQTQILYVSAIQHINFDTPRHGVETLLPRKFLREISEDLEVPEIRRIGHGIRAVTDDPVLRTLASRIQPYFDQPEALDPLQADHHMWALGIYVSARHGDLAARRPRPGTLSTWQERLAKDVIETSLIGGIGLAELAGFCGLRTSQFASGFRRSTGMAPYQWLMRRRVARAQDYMRTGEAPLAEIALLCGFADQSHFTRVFARHVGQTPRAWQVAL